jgi:hypothetical protein
VTIIFILLSASALAGLAIGLFVFRVEAILLASPFVASLPLIFLRYDGFDLVRTVLTSAGSLTVLHSFYLLGAVMKYLTMDDG